MRIAQNPRVVNYLGDLCVRYDDQQFRAQPQTETFPSFMHGSFDGEEEFWKKDQWKVKLTNAQFLDGRLVELKDYFKAHIAMLRLSLERRFETSSA